ncbi:MAG: prefoldin subunit alpha [archaeon]
MDKEKMMELQVISYQLEQMQQQIQTMEQQMEEVQNVQASLKDFGSLKAGDEILVPVANGMFATAELKDSKTLKINVGSDVVVEKSIDQSVKMLDKHVEEVMRIHNDAIIQFQGLAEKAQKLQSEMEK